MSDLGLDVRSRIYVEARVPFWTRVVIPAEDVDNWESKLTFKF